MIVYADMRWPPKTGIGTVKTAVASRAPSDVVISGLPITSRIGSPISTISIAQALSARRIQRTCRSLFWSPGFIPPAWSAVPTVITIHDLTHLRYYSKLHAVYYNAILRPLYHRCQAIICVSEYTKNEFLNWSRVSPERVTTVYNGVATQLFAEGSGSGLSFPYVLYAGNRRNYKNLDRLVEAFAGSSLSRDGVNLVLTGDTDRHLQNLAARFGMGDRLVFAGQVSDKQLASLYRSARLVAFVSLYEGFGLPILEAMAAGVPVLTSCVSAMPEISGDAALIVDPTSVDEIIYGLDRLHHDDDLRRNLVRNGRINATKFDWDRTAAAYWEIMRNASEAAVR
jgi:glycosyltransferase involved in cell wall biosynthesis